MFREPKGMNSWYAASAEAPAQQPALAGDTTCEICIIGGGITGLSAAQALARDGFQVVLLEAQRLGWASSGRNGGIMTPYAELDPRPLEKALGAQHAKRYWELSAQAVEHLRDTVEALKIDCELKPGLITAAATPEHFAAMTGNLTAFRQRISLDAEIIGPEEIRQTIGTSYYHGGLLLPQVDSLHPLKLTYGMARAALHAGASIHEGTRVTHYRENSGHIEVCTAGGHKITCNKILLASNAYLGQLQPELSKRFVALYSNMLATEPLRKELAQEILQKDVAVMDTQKSMAYYRLSHDNRLIFGGGGLFTGRDAKVVRPLLTKTLRRQFPQLENTAVEHVWGGWFGMTLFGDTPDVGRVSPNIFYAQAIPVVWAVLHGQLLSEALRGETARYDILSSIDIPPGPGGPLLSNLINNLGNAVAHLRMAVTP